MLATCNGGTVEGLGEDHLCEGGSKLLLCKLGGITVNGCLTEHECDPFRRCLVLQLALRYSMYVVRTGFLVLEAF